MNRRILIAGAVSTLALFSLPRRLAAQAEVDVYELLQNAADAMNALNSVKWRLVYVDGTTELFGQISLKQGEGAYTRPNLLVAKAEAKASFLSIDVNAISNGKKVWIDAVGFSRTVTPSESLSEILSDPLAVVADILLAIEDAKLVENAAGTAANMATITGIFNPALVENEAILDYLDTNLRLPVEIVLDSQYRVVSAQQSGAVVGYDSDDVVRKVAFWDYDVPVVIVVPG